MCLGMIHVQILRTLRIQIFADQHPTELIQQIRQTVQTQDTTAEQQIQTTL